MNLRNIGFAIAVAISLTAVPALGANKCPPTPANLQGFEFAEALVALWVPCEREYSQKEQVFIAGLTQKFVTDCGAPRNPEARGILQKFLTSSALVGSIGSRYGSPDLGEGLGDQAASMSAYALGEKTATNLGCEGDTAKRMTNNLVSHLKRTASDGAGQSTYVAGCAKYYAGRYSVQQCQCIADIGRSIYPKIHQYEFSRDSIYSIIQSNPFVGLQVGIQCGIGDY